RAAGVTAATLLPLGLYLLVRAYELGNGRYPQSWLNLALATWGVLVALGAAVRAQAAPTRSEYMAETVPGLAGFALMSMAIGTVVGLFAGLVTGRIHLQSLHTTLGLAINENEPLLLRDFQSMLERIAPQDATYLHDDFSRRVEIALDEPVNGHAHCRQLLVSGFATLLVEEGDLVLGRWQPVFAVELDG